MLPYDGDHRGNGLGTRGLGSVYEPALTPGKAVCGAPRTPPATCRARRAPMRQPGGGGERGEEDVYLRLEIARTLSNALYHSHLNMISD